MGLSASQGRLLMLTARQNDLEFQAQQISQQRLSLATKLDDISQEYETAVSNRQMIIAMQDSDGTSILSNLTYSKLVSGAAALGTASGLNQVEGINTSDNANPQAFRLVMGDTIVVSDVSEIPGKTSATYSNTTKEKDEDLGINLYVQKSEETNESTDKTTSVSKKYFSIEDIKNSDLGKLATTDDLASDCQIFTDNNSYYIKYGDAYYDLTGKQAEVSDTQKQNLHEYTYDDGSKNSNAKVNFVYKKTSVPENVSKNIQKVSEEDLSNNGITINGVRYLVDKDLAGENGGINYLQNCLRNGKYTIERYSSNSQILEDPWSGVSWDAASNITDQYYEDDDAEAKAKYDRLSKQVESQDKKLQLDLDNIETQRDAVKTEKDSVKDVISNNVENTFNTFG